jgi:metal-responsive CopG/Arc/MetJ family transcriptional regulator
MKETQADQDGKRVTIWLPQDLIKRIDDLADKAELDRGKLLRNLIQVGIETLEESEKVGLLQFSVILRDMKAALHDWVENFKTEGFKKFWS